MANELYLDIGSAITWTDTGGDEDLDLGGLAAGSVRLGSYHDWGVDPRPGFYQLTIFIDGFDTAPVVDESVLTYIAESQDNTNWSGPVAPNDTTDAAGSTATIPNLSLGPFPVFVHSTTAGDDLVKVYDFFSSNRYHAPVVHNNTADALLSTSDAHKIIITPYAWQTQ